MQFSNWMMFWLCPQGGDLAYSSPTLNPMQGRKQNKTTTTQKLNQKTKMKFNEFGTYFMQYTILAGKWNKSVIRDSLCSLGKEEERACSRQEKKYFLMK